MRVYFNSRDSFCKNPFGAVKTGTPVTIRIKVYEPIKGLQCKLVLWKENEKIPQIEMEKEKVPLDDGAIVFKAELKAPDEGSIIWYHFILMNFEEKYFYSNNDGQFGGVGKLVDNCPISYQQTVYKNDKCPDWFKEGIVYQIFPDRFNKGSDYEDRKEKTLKRIEGKDHGKVFVDDWNKEPRYNRDSNGAVLDYDFYGGTLKGIEEKLPYLKKLGVSCIYLNPIFEARSNHRYDTGDYMKIDSLLGDDKSFNSLVTKAKKVGIGIILDGVFSHQGADSKYFNKYNNYDTVGAYNGKESEYYSWYSFLNYPTQYESWWGVCELPNTKELNKTYLDYICKNPDSVIKHWMSTGIVGFRLDVADELPDEFIVEIRKAMDKVNKDNILIGEVWEDATNKISYDIHRKYFLDASLKAVTNYPFMNAAISFMKGNLSPRDLSEFFYKQMENYPIEYFYSNVNLLDSHDRVRIITELADSRDVNTLSDEEKYNHKIDRDKYLLATSRLKALSVLQYTIPGTPLLYYGDEVGVYGYTDPYNRKTYPWGKEDENLLSHYIALGEMRTKYKALVKGDFKLTYSGNHTIGFERNYKKEKVIVLVNRGIFYNEGEHVEIDVDGKEAIGLLNGGEFTIENGKLSVDMTPLGYRVLKIV